MLGGGPKGVNTKRSAHISRSCDLPKQEIFEELHKQLKNDFGIEFSFWEILMADISWSCD
jgi:hypothetical protein